MNLVCFVGIRLEHGTWMIVCGSKRSNQSIEACNQEQTVATQLGNIFWYMQAIIGLLGNSCWAIHEVNAGEICQLQGGVVSSITHVINSLQQICSQHPKIQGRCVVNTGVKPPFNYGYHLPPYIVACSKPVPSLGVPTMVGANCCRRARAWSQVHSSKICERWWMFDDDDDEDDYYY